MLDAFEIKSTHHQFRNIKIINLEEVPIASKKLIKSEGQCLKIKFLLIAH